MTIPKESILLVDDEEAIRCILNKGLAMRGYECDEAENADQAMEKLEANPRDLVIMDINMPGRLGNEVLPEMTSRYSETAVVMSSGVTDTQVIAQCIKDGAQGYIAKPFRFEQVLQAVSTALDKRRLQMEIQHYFHDAGKRARRGTDEPRKLFLGAIQTLVNTLEAGDNYSKGHSQLVAELALMISRKLGLTSAEMDDIYWAALLHDVGKIAVDPFILNKPGALTDEEYKHVMSHAVVGPRLVEPFVNEKVVEIISHHHDHYDGKGHEQTLIGARIPIGARIVSVADAYQAMISERPYRHAMSRMDAIEELEWCSGTQFDPIIANVLIDALRRESLRIPAARQPGR